MEKHTYKYILQEEIVKRCERNPRYSLRAFARSLGLDPAALSRILSGKIVPSAKMTEKLMNELNLSVEERAEFLHSVKSVQASRNLQRVNPLFKNNENEEVIKPKELSADAFRTVADWYHYAILELTFTPNFKAEPKYISKALSISELEASLALERLFALELLAKVGDRVVKTSHKLTTADKSITTSAHRRRQKQILEKSVESLENDKIENRSHTGMTMAIDPKKLPEAKKMIQDFNRLLCEFLESGEQTHVYELSIGLFTLQKSE